MQLAAGSQQECELDQLSWGVGLLHLPHPGGLACTLPLRRLRPGLDVHTLGTRAHQLLPLALEQGQPCRDGSGQV